MKLISSLALVAALYISSSTALELCGSKKNVNIYDSKFAEGSVNPMNEMCIKIEGEFESTFNYGSVVEFTAAHGGITKTWKSDAYSSMRPNSVLLEKGEHEFQACSFLPPEYQNAEKGQISIKVEFYNKDSEGDLVPFFCVKGGAPIKK
ncbi:MAG: hypothetical protein J3Q66DRAFT_115073 [Benniella sp.]|nr:MAG: hypothetical protein J3Q66DRAFT_115073 [Benniella sp.]